MIDPDNRSRKENRKKSFFDKQKKSFDLSAEQKFLSKSKKAFKQKKQHLEEEELWEDWDNKY
jgi:hypothetical protein